MRRPVTPTIFHVSAERGWRGGENQLALLLRYLDRSRQHLMVPRGSELQRRAGNVLTTSASGFGFFHPGAAWRLRKALLQAEPSLLHAHSSKALETAILARLRAKVPLVVSRRTAYPVRSGWKYRAADAVIAVSHAAREQLVHAGVAPDRITIIPDAVDTERFGSIGPHRPEIPERAVLVLCAAAFSAEKDHATLLAAWRLVEDSEDTAYLALAGAGELDETLRAQSAALGLRRVLFLGWREDLPSRLLGADIAAVTSSSEGLSSFLCEAQWCGKPVVATDTGGIPDAVRHGEGGLLSPVGDPRAVAANLLRLIEDAELRRRFGQAAQARARRVFDPLLVADAHARVYADLLDRRPRAIS